MDEIKKPQDKSNEGFVVPPIPSSKPITGNKTPDPHPEHGKENKNPEPSKSLKDLANQVTDQQVDGKGESFGFNLEQSQMPQTNVAYKSHKAHSNWKLILLGVLAFIFLGMGGYSAYAGDFYWIRDIFGMGLPKDPVKALEKAFNNTDKLNSMTADTTAGLSFSFMDYEFKFSGTADYEIDQKNKKSKAIFNINNLDYSENLIDDYQSFVPTNEIDLKEAFITIKDNATNVEVVFLEDVGYVRIPNLSQDWYKIDMSSFGNFSDAMMMSGNADAFLENPLAASVAYPSGSGVDSSALKENFTNFKKEKDETRNGERVYHYSAKINLGNLIGDDSINQYVDQSVNFWVSKKLLVITEISFNLNFDMNMGELGGFGKTEGSFNFTMDIDDYNKEVEINEPTEVVDLDEEAFFSLIAGEDIKPGNNINAQNSKRKSDINQIRTALELYYIDNNKYPEGNSDSRNKAFLSKSADKYLVSIPNDPEYPKYYYGYTSDGSSFTLTYVEVKEDGKIEIKKVESN